MQTIPVLPWDHLLYIFGEIMYSGHSTYSWDRRTWNAYLRVCQHIGLFEGSELDPGFKSAIPDEMNYKDYSRCWNYIFPTNPAIQIFIFRILLHGTSYDWREALLFHSIRFAASVFGIMCKIIRRTKEISLDIQISFLASFATFRHDCIRLDS